MIIFKTYFKILRSQLGTVLLYTSILLFFGIFNMQSSESSMSFTATKPDIFIVDLDQSDLSKHLYSYMEERCNIKDLENEESKINDAIFYRDVSYVIYIPENYQNDVLNDKEITFDILSTGDYEASLAQMILERYDKVQRSLDINDFNLLIENMDEILDSQTEIQMTSKVDTALFSKATYYFNFASYSIMACVIFIVSLVLTSFKEKTLKKRTIISPVSNRSYNGQLLLGNGIYCLLIWIFYCMASLILVGTGLLSLRGLMYFVNAFVLTFASLTLATLISTIVENKEVVTGVVNVIALGSSFLTGVFVPASYLPDFVLKIAHILPSYWYVQSNEILKELEVLNMETMQPILINMIVIIGFGLLFIVVNGILSKRKQKFG